MHPRTKLMLETALLHAAGQFETSCATQAPDSCKIYEGSVWNRGAYVTVIIDRCLCPLHALGAAFSDVEVWVYDIAGLSPVYMGKDSRPENIKLLKEPGDLHDPMTVPHLLVRN